MSERSLAEIRAELREVTRQRDEWEARRRKLASEEGRIRRASYNPPTGIKRSGTERDGVASVELAPYLQRWNRHNSDLSLQEDSTVSMKTIGSIRSGKTRFVSLTVAERLLMAMGLQHLLGDEIPIIPNPYFQRADRDDSCG